MKQSFFLTGIAMTLLFFASCNNKATAPSPIDSSQINVEGVARMPQLGFEMIAIQDKTNEFPVSLFEGSFDDSLLNKLVPEGKLPASINVFLACSDNHTVLFDAGLGSEAGGNLLAKLEALKVKPEQVDAVMLTHLHFDHIGGLMKDGQPLFPNATLYLSVDEFNAWSDSGEMKGKNGEWLKVLASYATRVQPFCDGDTLLGFIVAHVAPGHTPGHTLYQLDECLVVGDLLHAQDLQLDNPGFCAKYDGNPSMAVDSRQKWLQYAADNKLYICGAHCHDQFIKR